MDIPLDAGDKAQDFCKKIAERVGIDAERLGITKVYIDPEDFTFRRTVYLDGDPLEVRWTLEGYEDIQALKGKDAAEEFVLSTVEDQLKEILKC